MLLQRIADWGGPPRSSTTCEMRCCHTKGYSFPTAIFWERSCGEVRMYQKQTFNIKYTQTNLWFQTKKNDSKKNPRRSFPPKFSYQNPATKKNIKTEENLNTSAIPTWEMDILLRQVGLPHRIAVSGLWQSPYLAQSSQWQNSSVFCLIKK